jgi:hypothetical protein
MPQTAAQETALVLSAGAGIPSAPGINSPEFYQGPITPSDSTDLNFRCRVVWCGTAGNIAAQNPDGSTFVVPGVPANQWVQLRTNRIMATGTTAANITVGH